MQQPTILMIDDHPEFLADWTFFLDGDFECQAANSGAAGLSLLEKKGFDLILLDIDLGAGMDGYQFLEALRKQEIFTPVVMISKYQTIEHVVKAMKLGATDYIGKDPSRDELRGVIERTLHSAGNDVKRYLTDDAQVLATSILGNSKAIQQVREQVVRYARVSSNVLITGESGTGKDIVARQIHALSVRNKQQLVALNCASIPEQLFESEIFGSEKGAFTGAYRRRFGRFELAHRGTLFLDEIAELSLPMQAKLLRVIEEGKCYRVGGEKPIPLDVRLITATKQNPAELKKSVKFRDDLYYRLKVAAIEIPPLRERLKDIPLLVQTFIHRLNRKLGKSITEISDPALNLLVSHDWPGNVRELEHAIEVAMIHAEQPVLTRELLLTAVPLPAEFKPYAEAKQDFQKEYVLNALRASNGKITHAARRMGLTRYGLQKIMKQLGLQSLPLKEQP